MPALIIEQFYMPILLLNTYGFDLVLKTARGLEVRVCPWANTRNLRVQGQIDTSGNIHSVWSFEPILYPPIVRLHPVKFDGDPHYHMAIAWLVPPKEDSLGYQMRPWEEFNLSNQEYYNIRFGVVHLRDLHHRTSLLQRLKRWVCSRHDDGHGRPIVMHPGQAFKFKDGEMVP